MSIFSPDGRTKVSDTTTFPFSAVGIMFMRWKGADGIIDTADDITKSGSGSMIDAYHFLTAGHCVYDKIYGWADKIEVMLGTKGNIIAGTSRSDYEYYGEAKSVYMRSYEGWTNNKDFNYDLGLITLDRNIGNFTGWFGYGYDNNLSSGTLMNVVGYPGDKLDPNGDKYYDNYDMWTQSGRITSTTDLTLRSTELDIIAGNSGGPLWLYNPNTNQRTIYGVVSNERTAAPYFNEFTRITSSRYNDINNWINEDNTTRKPTDKADLVDYDVWFNTSLGNFSTTTIKYGKNFSITVYPRNNGTAATGSFSVSFYASTDRNVTDNFGSHYLIGNVTMSSINPFNWGTATWSGLFPNIPIGNYYVVSFLDPTNSVQEFDDSVGSNQKVFSSLLTVLPLTIFSSVTYTLTANQENLTLTGTGNINGTGNLLNNVITGNTGNNILDGKGGSDTLIGDLGNDTYIVDVATDQIVENLNAGTDTVKSSVNWILGENLENLLLSGTVAINGTGNTLNNTITGNTGNNILDGQAGNDTLLGDLGNDIIYGADGDDYVDGGAGDDKVADINGDYAALKGGLGNDTIYGGSGRDIIDGQDGDDTLYGDAPNQAAPTAGLEINEVDVIFGGDGNDYINGGYGGDYLRGGNGDDTIYGGASTDLLFGDDGNDYIDGGAGDDQDTNRGEGLKGGLGDDIILGGDGTDAVHGQPGNDILLGGTGNDLLTGGGGVNTLLGGTGNDLYYLVYLDPNNPVVNDSGSIIQDESGIDTLTLQQLPTNPQLNISNFPLSISNLARVGTALVIDLNKDNKFIFAQDITILNFFGTGKTKGTGFIEYIAGLDSTSFLSLAGNNPKTGTTGNDRDQSAIKGTTGNDYLGGQTGKDQIYGYAGNDILVAKGGKDELYGGTGDDLYLVSAADGFATIIQDDGGYDALNLKDVIISLSELQSGKVGLYRWDDNNLLIDLNKDGYGTRSDDLFIHFFFDPTAIGAKAGVGFIEQLGNVSGYDVLNLFNALPRGGRIDETINFIPSAGLGNDTYIGTSGNDLIYGGDGNDIINGGPGRDRLQGDNGNDIIYGGDGDDRRPDFTAGLRGGIGNDVIYGGYGDDIIDGQDDVDIIYGDEGDDIIFGGSGNDKVVDPNGDYAALKGGGGYDIIYGGFGDDIIDGGDGDDRLYGDEISQDILNQTLGGNDVIAGGAGDDYIDLGYGNDLAWGGDGNDILYGAAGVDRVNGDAGNDFIDGGAGNDKVVDPNGDYAALKGGGGNDTIYGSFGDDIIDGQDGDDKLYGDDKDFPGRNPAEGGNDVIFGGTGNDYIDTGFGNDLAWGGDGNDTIYGGAGLDILSGEAGNDSLYLGLNDNAIDIVKYASGHGTDTIYQFVRGVGGDQLQFTGIAKIDVVKSGTSTQLRIGDGLAGNTGFGTGQLLATISGTSGFISSDVNVNLFGANFLFT